MILRGSVLWLGYGMRKDNINFCHLRLVAQTALDYSNTLHVWRAVHTMYMIYLPGPLASKHATLKTWNGHTCRNEATFDPIPKHGL